MTGGSAKKLLPGAPHDRVERRAEHACTPWPVPFRFALTALAPQPGAPSGAKAAKCWPSETAARSLAITRARAGSPKRCRARAASARRRACARWRGRRPNRAYAVGDSEKGAGQMWLWRGETGLWEKDPAMPLNFRGNLLGIAFDPNNSARGYAVGQRGVLLSYGKSWTQEEEAEHPARRPRGQLHLDRLRRLGSDRGLAQAHAAGPERLRRRRDRQRRLGLARRRGRRRGRSVRTQCRGRSRRCPTAARRSPRRAPPRVRRSIERGSPGRALAGRDLPRRLRSRRAGGVPGRRRAAGDRHEQRTGDLHGRRRSRRPLRGSRRSWSTPIRCRTTSNRGVLRQTATGWSDEEHELNDAREPPGGYVFWDTPKVPTRSTRCSWTRRAPRVGPSAGWSTTNTPCSTPRTSSGIPADGAARLRASPPHPKDHERRPRDVRDRRRGSVRRPLRGARRHRHRARPCGWRRAISRGPGSGQDSPGTGCGAFVYTGPGVTSGQTAGPPADSRCPWQEEERYCRSVVRRQKLPSYAAPSPTDREGARSEGAFASAFAGLRRRSGRCWRTRRVHSHARAAGPPLLAGLDGVHLIMLDPAARSGDEERQWLES